MELVFFKSLSSPIHTLSVLYIHFPLNKLPNNDAPNISNNILKNLPSCFFILFLIVLFVPFNNISCSSNAVAILIKSFKSLFNIINVLLP